MGRHGDGCVYKPKGRRFYYYENAALGIPRTSAETESKKEAQELLRSRNNEVRAGLSPSATKVKLAELIRDKLLELKNNNMPSLRNAKIRAIKHVLPYFGEMRAKDVNAGKISDYINYRKQQTWRRKNDEQGRQYSNSEINRELELIMSAFSLGKINEKVQIIPHIAKLEEPSARSGYLERPQLETLLKSFRVWAVSKLIHFYYITGWRHKEGSNMRWSYVSFETRRITLPGEMTKNGLPRVFPFTPDLGMILSEMRQYTDEIQSKSRTLIPWVFHRDGAQIKTFAREWNYARKQAGLATLIIHDFRRTAVRNLELAGVPRQVAKQMVGMESNSTYERYRIVAEKEHDHAATLYAEFEKKMKERK